MTTQSSYIHTSTPGNTEYRPSPGFFTGDDNATLRHISEAVHRVNEVVIRAVNAGVSVELVRASRCHDECGNWGDQMTATIRKNNRRDLS